MADMTQDKVLIAVMSYNMGELLENCLASIERNAPGFTVAIFDDRSTDPVTCEVLERYQDLYSVRRTDDYDKRELKTGGLHANMNRAVRYAVESGKEYVFFIQDDMQLVRPIDEGVLHEYGQIFSMDDGIAQVRCTFMRSPVVNPDHSSRSWLPSHGGIHYERVVGNIGVLDTGIVSVNRLVEKEFEFVPGEGNNSVRSSAIGLRSVFPKNPVYMWLPWPPTHMGRLSPSRRTLNRLTDLVYNVGFHPFRDMTPTEVEVMKERSVEELPYAERFLTVAGRPVKKPWCYEHSYAYLAALAKELKSGRWPWRKIH